MLALIGVLAVVAALSNNKERRDAAYRVLKLLLGARPQADDPGEK
jgi:outer membrane protein TolC